MPLPLSPEPSDRQPAVRVLDNEVSTAAVMTTAQTRSITTGPTASRSEVENRSTNNYFVHFDGNWNHSVNGTDNTNYHGIGDNLQSMSTPPPGSFPRRNSSNSLGVPLQHPRRQAGSPVDSTSNMPSPVPDTCEPLPPPESTTTRGYAEHFESVSGRIEEAYNGACRHVLAKRVRRSREGRGELRLEFDTQRATYSSTNASLVKALLNLSAGGKLPDKSINNLCHDAHQALNEVWCQLHRFKDFIERCSSKKDLSESLKALESKLDDFAKVARPLIKDSTLELPSTTTHQKGKHIDLQEIARLSTEGRASTMLYQCLCRACPEQTHFLHTAYLSLEPDQSEDCPLPSPSELAPVMWQCHMAFKSTIPKKKSLIWLKVVSSGSIPEHQTPQLDSSHHELDDVLGSEMPTGAAIGNSRKRRSASTPPEPSPKVRKTRPGQSVRRISEPAPPPGPPSRFGVCPELLAQHDVDSIVVMNMTDDDGYNHNIYYLPKEKRPIHDMKVDPITLSVILGNTQGRQKHDRMCAQKIWTLRLSRLIAEAVLRFDLRDSDPDPQESVVFYESPQRNLAPFLEVAIKKPRDSSPAIEEDGHASGRRSVLLVNLGQILLQLGLPKKERAQIRNLPQDLSDRRSSIKRLAANVQTHMADAYYEVIIQCIILSECGDDVTRIFEEAFKERYYQGIVHPLGEMETRLISEERRAVG